MSDQSDQFSPRDEAQQERLREELSQDVQLEERAIESLEREGPIDTLRGGHPPGLFLLFITEMWERFSYYGMRTLLTLFMLSEISAGGMGWTERIAGPVYGWYTSLVYLTPLFGGMLADKLLGTHRSMLIGGAIIALGHVVLGFMGLFEPASPAIKTVFFSGLALVIIGTGFFKPCVSVMVGQLYRERDPRRDAGFTIFYMGINVGAFLGIIACAWLGEQVGWHWGFGAAAVGMIAGMIVYVIGRPKLLSGVGLAPENPDRAGPLLTKLGLAALGIVLFGGLYVLIGYLGGTPADARAGWLGWTGFLSQDLAGTLELIYAATLGLAAVIGVGVFVAMQAPEDRGPTTALFIIAFFVLFFWLAFEQAGSSLNEFALFRTDRNIVGDWEFPAGWLQGVNPMMILLFAPVFALLWTALAKRGRDPNIAIKVGVGLLLVGAGFVLMVLAGARSDGGAPLSAEESPNLVHWWWLAGTYVLHTWGELCLSPIGLSLTTKLAPRRYVSFMMGVWFLAPAVAQLIGGYTFGAVRDIEQGGVLGIQGRGGYFMLFVLIGGISGLAMLALTPIMKRLVGNRA